MNLVKITDVTGMLGVTSRSLRYYEQAGLIQSVRLTHDKYRYYDAACVERIRQILVLRKMQVPIKDILHIYRSRSASVVVETFVRRIREIDEEVNNLLDLRRIVEEFMQAMARSGITKISALPLLYEKTAERLDTLARRQATDGRPLSDVSDRLSKSPEPSIIALPPTRMLTSYLKGDARASDPVGFERWTQKRGLTPGGPGAHGRFEYQADGTDVVMLAIPEDFVNESPFADTDFEGGLYAAANVYLDEELGERFRALVACFDGNPYYEVDYTHAGRLRHEALVEDLISPDGQRALVSLLVPVKKRWPDPALFGAATECAPNEVSLEQIERETRFYGRRMCGWTR